MTFHNRIKDHIYFLIAFGMIRHHSIQHIFTGGKVRKGMAAFPLVCLISIFSISSLQACQPITNRKDISAMNQKNFDPQLPPDVELIRDSSNGTVRILKGVDLATPLMVDENYRSAIANGRPGEIAIAFINAYGRLFKLEDPRSELTVSESKTDKLSMTHVRLKQQYKGLEVWPAEINVHFNESGQIYLVQGRYAKTPSNLDDSRLEESDALRVVSKNLAIKDKFRQHRTKLIIYCGLPRASRLAYRIYAEVSVDNAWNYIIDAQTGAILEKTSAVQNQGDVRKPSAGKIILK
jgi:hypothetical protein